MPIFTDENIEQIFGAEAAESESNERFKQYFYFNKAYENFRSSLPMRILVDHKGVGKSALIKRSVIADIEDGIVALKLGPSDFTLLSSAKGAADFNKHVAIVRQELIGLITGKILGAQAEQFMPKETTEHLSFGKVIDVIADKINRFIEKKAPGFQHITADLFLKNKTVNVYIDDIDRGWAASAADIRNISALLNAMRDISGSDNRVRFRIGLRSDVYFLVRTSDESTDKIESSIVWLEWTLHEILCLMALRIETWFKLSQNQSDIISMKQEAISSKILSKVIEPSFIGQGHWSNRPIHNILLSLARRRPRDLVKLMHGAAKRAYKNNNQIISSTDLQDSFENYSNERLQDIVNEFKTEMPSIEQFLLHMKPAKKEKFASMNYLFTKDELIRKIKIIRNNVNISFTNKKPVTDNSLVQFLYKIEFITARIEINGVIERRYFDNSRFLSSEFVDFGYQWEVHPAYRWALQPQSVQRILDGIRT